jgi:hypothetical protein
MSETLSASPKAKRFAQIMNEKKAARQQEIEDAVIAFKREQEDYQRAQPTHERMSKGDIKRTVVKGEGIRYRPRQDIVERYEGKWRPESQLAFMRLQDDAKAADVTGVTIDYHRSGGGSGGRMGGLGDAQRKKLEAYARFQWVMDRLPGRSRRLCEWLLLGEKIEATGQHPTLFDVGQYLFPFFKDVRSNEMLGLGAMIMTGDFLASLYSSYQIELNFRESRVHELRTVNG